MNEAELRASRRTHARRLTAARKLVVRLKRLVARRDKQLKALEARKDPAAIAARFIIDRYGRTENNNRAPWLDKWSRLIGEWMVGQPWCGLLVWMACRAAGLTLDKRTVSTIEIRNMAREGRGGWKAWHSASATPRIGWCPVYGTSGPVHVGMIVRPGEVGEGNTSAGKGGSQNDGGGCWPRSLNERRSWILGYAEPDWNKAKR